MMKLDPLLVHKGIPKSEPYYFRKWLRYYLDFCKKYHFPESKPESLPHFIKKLQEKHQSSHQQIQAAVALLHSYCKSSAMARRLAKRTRAHAPTLAAWPHGRTFLFLGGPCLSAASWSAFIHGLRPPNLMRPDGASMVLVLLPNNGRALRDPPGKRTSCAGAKPGNTNNPLDTVVE